MFFEKYSFTGPTGLPVPKFSGFARGEPWGKMNSGLYSNGLVTIVDQDFDDGFMASWSWLVGDRALLIGFLCWGDFFYACSKEKKFFIVLADQQKRFALGNSLSAVFDKNIASPEFEEQIVRPDEFKKAVVEAGPLEYGQCYIVDRGSSLRVRKKVSIFLDVLGQTGSQLQ
ncbi:hypothetical protein [Gilvimarinus polysaccharolyticus]|uniref:hypothetical protein n=1 Tax=Gilvimarinus polysaccharolyticus TaxID=863921 RepID=UPI0006730D01|nr:hypothetical protein [Gilvimarinus polysaccharolyticus]